MNLTATLPAARIRRWLGAGFALLALWAALILPNHPGAMTWGALALQPLDLAAVVLLLLLVRAATPVATAVWVLTLVKLVDVAGHLALGRALNPGTDLVLLPLGWALARDVLGLPAALAAAAALVVLAVLLWRGLRAACRRIAACAPTRARPALALGLVAALGLAVAETAKAIEPAWRGLHHPPRLGARPRRRHGPPRAQSLPGRGRGRAGPGRRRTSCPPSPAATS